MIASTTINGIPVELLLLDPDYSVPPELQVRIPVDAEVGLNRKEDRYPEGLHPRFKFSFAPDFSKEESEDVQTLQATLGNKRVAVPLFFDKRSSLTDTFLLEGSHFVSWNAAGDFAIDSDDYDFIAPLLIGRIENNTFSAITKEIGRTSVRIVEDCPYTHRVKIKNVATDSTFTLTPDYRQLQLVTNSPLKFTEEGQVRELFEENSQSVFRYDVNASFTLLDQDDIAYLLSFWYQKKGRLHSFAVPAWFQPSSNTPETPDAYRARFKGEVLRLSFVKPDTVRTSLQFVQLPWELNDSGIDLVTDKLFEDPSQWVDVDAYSEVSLIDTPSGINHMPERVVQVQPVQIGSNRGLYTDYFPASEGDVVVVSALVARTPEVVSPKAPRFLFQGRDASQDIILTEWGTGDNTLNTTAKTIEDQFSIPANVVDFRVRFVSPNLDAAVDPDAYSYFGDPKVIHFKSGAEVLAEEPVKAPRSYFYTFNFDVPNKESIRFIDWESSLVGFGNEFKSGKVVLKSLKAGTKLFNEEATILIQHNESNPLLALVSGGLERLVKISIGEANPLRPETATGLFSGTLKSLKGRGLMLEATFTAFGGVFNKRTPNFALQPKCNYVLGDANCKKDLGALAVSGSSTNADLSDGNRKIKVNSITGTLTTANDPNAQAGDRFSGGYLVIGDADNYQIRFVKKTTLGIGTNRTFSLNRPIDVDKLDASDGVVTIYPGCGGTVWECKSFWSNYANFGGHPFIPEQLDTIQGSGANAGK